MRASKNDEPFLAAVLFLPFIVLVLCPLVFIGTNWLNLFVVTRTLGTDTSAEALYEYLDSSITIGLSREEAHDKIRSVTPLLATTPRMSQVEGTTCEWVSLYVAWVPAIPLNGSICYASDMRVISAGGWNASLP